MADMGLDDISKWFNESGLSDYQFFIVEDDKGEFRLAAVSSDFKTKEEALNIVQSHIDNNNKESDHSKVKYASYAVRNDNNEDNPLWVTQKTAQNMKSLVIDPKVFKSFPDAGEEVPSLPVAFNMPDPAKTRLRDIYLSINQTAFELGSSSSGIEQYSDEIIPDEIKKEDLVEAEKAYMEATKDYGMKQSKTTPFGNLFYAQLKSYVDQKNGEVGLGDAYFGGWIDDAVEFRWTVESIEGMIANVKGPELFRKEFKEQAGNHPSDAYELGAKLSDSSDPGNYLKQKGVIEFDLLSHPKDKKQHKLISEEPGDSLSILPNEGFRRLLNVSNVSIKEYEDYLTKISGGNFKLTRDNPAWQQLSEEFNGNIEGWAPKPRPYHENVISPSDLVEVIESSPNQEIGTFVWAVQVNDVSDVFKTPPEERVTISGGQFGVQNHKSGGGFLKKADPNHSLDLMLGRVRFGTNDQTPQTIQQLYADRNEDAFKGKVDWSESDRHRYFKNQMDTFISLWAENGAWPKKASDVYVENDVSYYNDSKIAPKMESMRQLYGMYPQDIPLTETDKTMIRDNHKSNEKNHFHDSGMEP